MRKSSLLVLVRWQGDVIAAHTVEQGGRVQDFGFLDSGTDMHDVHVEMYDVTPERIALGKLKPARDLRTAYAIAVSTVLHLSIAVAALFTLATQSPPKLEEDDANRLASILADEAKTAAEEGADAGAVDPPKNNEQAKTETDPLVEPLTGEEDTAPPESVDQVASEEPQGAPAQEVGSVAPGSGGTDSITASPATCVHGKVPKNTGKVCHRTVVVSALTVPPSCFVDTVMKLGETGTLSYPCAGDGEVRLSFGKKSFSGASIGGKLDMCAGTEYPFSDGCRWTSAQRVSGRLAAQSLTFSYGEAPKVGETKLHCAAACSASGVVRVN